MAKIAVLYDRNENDRRFARLVQIRLAKLGVSASVGTVGNEAESVIAVSSSPDGPFIAFIVKEAAGRPTGFVISEQARQMSPSFAVLARPVKTKKLDLFLKSFLGIEQRNMARDEIALVDNDFHIGDRTVRLSGREHALLTLLYENKGRTVSKKEIISSVWADDTKIKENTVNATMVRLRRKLSEVSEGKYILSVKNGGYTLIK